ncbi:MAG: hypothetical protein KDI39_08410 [Pseudomonadales bacterium]|nr:hypothetical protein [Pseudomonadales bacterium]
MKKIAIVALCAMSLVNCAQFPQQPLANNGQPRPAFKDSAIGVATVTSLIVAMEVKRQKTQETLRRQTNPNGIAKYQARLTAMDSVKNNLVSYSSGQLSLGDKISLISATTDLVRTKLPEYGDILTTLSTLGQVLVTAQQQAIQAGQQASGR